MRRISITERPNLISIADEHDLEYIAETAKSQGMQETVNNINSAVSYASKAVTILQRSLALATSEKAGRFQKDLLQHHNDFSEKITEVKKALPNQASDLEYYYDELDRAITKPLGIFQQQLKFLGYNDQSRVIFSSMRIQRLPQTPSLGELNT